MATAKHKHNKHFHWGNLVVVLVVAAFLVVASLLRTGTLHLVPDPQDGGIDSYFTSLETVRSENYFSDLVIEPATGSKPQPAEQEPVVPGAQPMNDLNVPKQPKQPSAASTKDSMLVSFTRNLNNALHQQLSVMAHEQAQVAGAEASKPIEPIRGWTQYPIRLGE